MGPGYSGLRAFVRLRKRPLRPLGVLYRPAEMAGRSNPEWRVNTKTGNENLGEIRFWTENHHFFIFMDILWLGNTAQWCISRLHGSVGDSWEAAGGRSDRFRGRTDALDAPEHPPGRLTKF